MLCLVYVKFLPGGSLAPEEVITRLGARWQWVEDADDVWSNGAVRAGLCIAEYDSIEQLAIDLSVMPGAGIGNIEVVPVVEQPENMPVS